MLTLHAIGIRFPSKTPNSNSAFAPRKMKIELTVIVVSLVATIASVYSQEPVTSKTHPSFSRVLESQAVDLGNRTIIYNRVETPLLKPVAALMPTPEIVANPTPLTSEEQAEALRWEQMEYQGFYPSATAYEGKGSEVFVWTQDGGVRFLSSIDFRYFQPLYGFEGEGVYYSTFFMLDLWTDVAVAEAKAEDPSLVIECPHFPQEVDGVSQFEVISPSPGEENEKAIAAMEALHVFYDQNRVKLIQEYHEGEAARIAHEQWLKDHPPIPQDTVINYFPIRSNHFQTSQGPFQEQ